MASVLDKFRLDEQVAVVTGGARGIGLAIATALAEATAKVVLADLDSDTGEASAARYASRAWRPISTPWT